jgi:two-component system sensor histidine kinase UhpB
MEIFLLQLEWSGQPFLIPLAWLRVGWLALSFIPLVIFGLLVLEARINLRALYIFATGGLLAVYGISLLINARIHPGQLVGRADALARYLLAVPGGVLAALALGARAGQLRAENRQLLASRFWWSAAGFMLYGLSQAFVPPMELFPALYVNSQVFLSWFGFPVQVLRAAMAVLITINLIKAVQSVERERENQLLAAQHARLEALELVQRDLIEREIMRRELLRHTVIAQEDERARIARELHDETAQFLTALSLNLATLRNSVRRTPVVNELLDRLQALSREMSQGIHRMVHDLRPAQLDDLGLAAALQYLADEERSRAGLEVTLEIKGRRRRLDPLVETVLFRVAQEALTNVARHSHCNRASVQLSFAPRQVILCIKDEGSGFVLDEKKPLPSGWGLAGMRERAESVGGQFNLHSSPGRGTAVEIVVPIAESIHANPKEYLHEHHPSNAG